MMKNDLNTIKKQRNDIMQQGFDSDKLYNNKGEIDRFGKWENLTHGDLKQAQKYLRKKKSKKTKAKRCKCK